MENITLPDIGIFVAFLVSLISGIAYLKKHLKEWIQLAVKSDFDTLNEKIETIQTDLTKMQDGLDQEKADQARYRILRFSDETLQGVKHTQEHFNQILQAITDYERYANAHPEYPNGMAIAAINNIKRVNQKCFEEDSFLR